MPSSRPSHSPFHLLLDNQIYWISASTLHHAVLLSENAKEVWKSCLKRLIKEKETRLYAWVLLNDHYHLLVHLNDGEALPLFMKILHGRTSFEINRLEGARGRTIWRQYWDRCIRDERDFYVRFNYLHHNPVKHHYTIRPEEYPHSSYQYHLNRYGPEWIQDLWEKYPIIDFAPEEPD